MVGEDKQDGRSTGDVATLEKSVPQKAKDIAKFGVVTIRKEESVYKAIGTMVEKHISGLPVVDDTGLVGIISEKDVLKLLYNTQFLSGTVEDYMTRDVVSFDEEDSLADICECLVNNSFRRIAILHQGKLVGLISRADIIKANKDKFKPEGSAEKSANHKDSLLAKNIMKCGLLTVKRGTPIYEAMEILAARNITGLPVVDDYMNLEGILSEKDLLKLVYSPQAKPVSVEEFMTEDVVSFEQDDTLFEVCDCLMNNSFRRVPILNQGKLVGIISRADIIMYILKNKSIVFKHKR